MKTLKLKGVMAEKGKTVADIAQEIGVNKSTMYRKMANNGESLTVGEANRMAAALELSASEATSIFFDQIVS